jgi:hypothetical protein
MVLPLSSRTIQFLFVLAGDTQRLFVAIDLSSPASGYVTLDQSPDLSESSFSCEDPGARETHRKHGVCLLYTCHPRPSAPWPFGPPFLLGISWEKKP